MNVESTPLQASRRLKTTAFCFGATLVVICFAFVVIRLRIRASEHRAAVEVSQFGGTFSMASAIDAQNKKPWFPVRALFFNHVHQVDLSTSAWPVVEAKKTGRVLRTLTDDDLSMLSDLSDLRSLDLRGTAVTDDCVRHLTVLQSLDALDLRETKVSEDAVARIQSALPNCRIIRH